MEKELDVNISESEGSPTDVSSQDPIYKSKDGKILTKSQLLSSGYDEERIKTGLDKNLISVIGDTRDVNQQFKSEDGRIFTNKQLIDAGYTQDRIDNGILNGKISPIEKKNQAASTPSPEGSQVGVSDGTISTIEPSKNAVDLAFDAFNLENQKITRRAPATIGFGTGGGEVVTTEEDPQAKAASKKIKEDLKAQGYDADKLYDDFKDINFYGLSKEYVDFEKQGLLNDYKQNPQQYEKKIAIYKFKNFLDKAISESPKELIDLDYNLSPASDYNSTRAKYKDIANRIREYGGDYEKELFKNFSVAVGDYYGQFADDPSVINDERNKYLNQYQISALQYLEDTNPDAAKGYGSMLVDPNLIKKGTAEEAGWQEKASSLEQIGLRLYKNNIESQILNLSNQAKTSPLSIKDAALAKELETKLTDVDNKIKEINIKYPIPAEKEAQTAAMELTDNTTSTWYNRFALSVGNAVDNTFKGVYEFAVEPFMNDEQSKLYQLAAAGESMGMDVIMTLPKEKRISQAYDWQMSPEVSSEYKAIMGNNSLSKDEKTQKVYKLLQENPNGFARIPIIGGKTNISPTSLYYSVTDLAATLTPYLALEAATAGGATAGIARKLASSFMAAAATGFHDNYVAAVREGAANPYKQALITTGIMSFAMAGAGTPQMIRAMAGNKTAIGELVNKLTDKEISVVLDKIKNGTLKNRILDYGKTLGKDAVKSIAEGAKGGVKFESIMAGAKAIDAKIKGKEVHPEELAKEGAIGVLNFTVFGGVMGIGKSAWKGVTDFQGSTLLKASQNPTEYLKAAAKSLADGTITSKDYNQIKNNIELASKVSEGIKFIDDKGVELPESKKAKLLLAKMQEAKLNEDAQGDIPSKLKEDLESQSAEVKNEIDNIQKSEEEEAGLPQIKEGERVYRVDYTDSETGKKTYKLFENQEEGTKFLNAIPGEAEGYYEKYDGKSVISTFEGAIKPTEVKAGEDVLQAEIPKAEEKPTLTGIEQEETIKQMKPFTDRMVEIERDFKNEGFEINTDYDNEIVVTDKNGEIVDAEELPDNLRKLAGDYEKATMKLGEFDASAREKALAESRKVTEVEAEVIESKKLELPSERENWTQDDYKKELKRLEKEDAKGNADKIKQLQTELGAKLIADLKKSKEQKQVKKEKVIKEESRTQEALNKYEEGEGTFNDLVDEVEAIALDENNRNLKDAVDAYREEQRLDIELKGRGDMDAAESAFMRQIKSELPPTPEKATPKVEEKTQEQIAQEQLSETETLLSGEAEKRRQEGKFVKDGVEYKRNEKDGGERGNSGEVRFTNEVSLPFKYKIVEAETLQPSHQNGIRNPLHFIPEAQPKNRNDVGSLQAEESFANNPRFEELGENTNAYSGAPVVNERGEVVQGNNRSAGLRKGYQRGNTTYKEALAENADKFGFTKEQVQGMKNPVLVREVAVSDAGAIELGNYDAKDLETGGKRRLDPVAITRRLPFNVKGRLSEIFKGDETLNQAIRSNAKRVIEILSPYLNQAQRNTITKEGELTEAGAKDLESVVQHLLFDGGDVTLPDLFEKLSHTQKEGLKKALPYIFSTTPEKSIVPEIQEAIVALNHFNESGAGNFDNWLAQADMFNESRTPKDIFSPTAIEIARRLTDAKSQKEIAGIPDVKNKIPPSNFVLYANEVNDKPATLLEEAKPGLSKKEGIKNIFKTEYDETKKPTSITRGGGEISGEPKAAEPEAAKPTKPTKPAKPRAEKPTEPKPELPSEVKEEKIGKFEEQARKIADKISKAELPKFMQTPEFLKDVKTKGLTAEELKKKLANAVIKMGVLLDKGIEYSKAFKEAVSELVSIGGEANRENVEKGFDEYYKGLSGGKEGVPPTTKENKNQSPEWDDNMTKVANAINDAYIEGKFGIDALDSVLAKLQDTDVKNIYEAVKNDIKGGKINVRETREKIVTTKGGSERDQAVLLYDLAELKGKEDQIQKAIIEETNPDKQAKLQKDLLDVQNEIMDNALANKMLGRTASNIFRIRQAWVNREADLVQMTQQYKASKGLKELTPEQEKEIKKAYNTIREAKAKVNKLKEELNAALEREEKAKKEIEFLNKVKSEAKEIKKKERSEKTSEKIEASQKRIQDAKEKLRQLRNGMNDITRVLPETALQISKIAAEKFYQGVVKFDELVKNVYDEVKDVFPEWTEKDIRKHLLPDVDIEAYYENREVIPKTAEDVKLKLNEYQRAQAEYAKLMFDWQKNRSSDIMEKRPFKERLLDSILRWQRFAVLSYPSTMVKLAAVVAHQLTLKPLKFGTQYLQNLILKGISPEAAKKQQIFGAPSLKALAKYYSEFIRNFSAQNLKEQFSGIDTREILYGKKFMYDEWAASKGLLEIPGRSHGYIKSFIKNPEFVFAHEQLTSWHLNKMAEIEKELKNPSLTPERKAELENEYKENDITNDEVLDKINSQSLAHSKWAIMMNDNKFVDKFRSFTKSIGGAGGALIQSELPIVKIPTNYIGRVFALKYGLIEAVIGKKGEKGYPGIVNIIRKGTDKLTNEQADLLGKALTLGSIGASFFLIGYMNSQNIKENEDGSFDIFGEKVSKNLIHSPEIESILSGAIFGNKYNRGDSFIKSWVEADFDIIKKNPFINMLTYGFIPTVAIALSKKRGEDKAADKITDAAVKKITDVTVPGFIKQIAQWSDVKEGGFKPTGEVVPRVPKGTNLERALQRFELAIPGLRQRVPEAYFKIEEKYKKEPGVKMLLDAELELPDLPKIESIKVAIDDRHPKGEMTKEDAKEYSEAWSKNLITALNQVEVMLKKSNIKPTQEQLKEIVGLAKENATQNAKTIMIDKGRFEEREKEEPVDFMEEIKEMIKEIEPQ